MIVNYDDRHYTDLKIAYNTTVESCRYYERRALIRLVIDFKAKGTLTLTK